MRDVRCEEIILSYWMYPNVRIDMPIMGVTREGYRVML